MPKKYSQKRIVQFLIGLWKISPYAVLGMIIMQVLFAILTTTIAPIFVSQLLTHVANGSATLQNSTGLLIGYVIMLFLGDVVSMRVTIALAFMSETKMQSVVASKILEHLMAKSLSYHANRMSGGIVSDAGKLNGSVERFWDTIIFNAIPIFTTVASVCIALSFMLWQYAVALAVLSIIVILVIIKAQSSIAPISKQVSEKSSSMTAYLADAIGNIAAVKAFANEKTEINNYKKLTNDWREANIKEMKSVLLVTGTFGVLMTIMNICAFIAAIFATEYHIASIGITYLVISYTLNVVNQLWQVSNITRSYIRIIGDAGPMISTLCEDIEVTDPVKPSVANMTKGKIEFKDVVFTHGKNEKALFNDFSLTVKPGEHVGLVGRSGSGKTSLTRILLRFNDIDSGTISIDGQDITSVKQADLHRAISYVPQEPALFHRTLRANIAYGKQNATDADILIAAQQANAMDFINVLPEGFETVVGERGIKLSGGQRQRIAIARAILKDAPILVLDEATSALDSENEKLIQDALTKLMKGRTSIVIAHRLSTIARLDRIIVLDNGKIAEQGTHSQLLLEKGIYAKLWLHQSGGFIEE